MRLNHKLGPLKILYQHLIIYPTPLNLNYMYNWGSLAGIVLGSQIVTGILLAMHYVGHVDHAFQSVQHLMTDVPSGMILRYAHANGASLFFTVVYMHIFRGIYYSSGNQPRELVWITGVVILLLMIITAFIGYVLPWGQMSFWGATVITSLATVIPVVGKSIVYWLWGGFICKEAVYYGDVIIMTLLDAGTGFCLNNIQYICCYFTNFKSSLFQGKVKIQHIYTKSAGFCYSLILYGGNTSVPYFCMPQESLNSQRLNAEDQMWLVGFVEGNGNFSVNKNGKYAKYEFSIELSKRDIQLLYKIKAMLSGYGSITTRTRIVNGNKIEYARLKIASKPVLIEVILPIFTKYSMLTSKNMDFVHFKSCLLQNIVLYEHVPAYSRPNKLPSSDILKLDYFDNWLVGFIEAEGCFSTYSVTGEVNKTSAFKIDQKYGLQILTAIKMRLKLLSNPYTNHAHVSLNTTSSRGIQNVLNFLSKTQAKLKGYKRAQYLNWLHKLRVNVKYASVNIPNHY